mgnify:CR=1 FL=1
MASKSKVLKVGIIGVGGIAGSHFPGWEASPNAEQIKDFIQFADSEEGRDVIRNNGTVPYLEGLNLMKNKLDESRQARRESGLR